MWPKGWSQTHRHTQCPHPPAHSLSLSLYPMPYPSTHMKGVLHQSEEQGTSDGAGGLPLASPAPTAFSLLSRWLSVPSQSRLGPETDHSSKKWTGFYLVLFAVLGLLELDASPSVQERARV